MFNKFSFKDLKPVFISLLFYLLICIIVYLFGSSMIIVNAAVILSPKPTDVDVNYSYSLEGQGSKTFSGTLDNPYKNPFDADLPAKFTDLVYTFHFDYSKLPEDLDKIYYSAVLHARYYYDVGPEDVFTFTKSFNKLKGTSDPFTFYLSATNDANIVDSQLYTSLDIGGWYSYDEFIYITGSTDNINDFKQ